MDRPSSLLAEAVVPGVQQQSLMLGLGQRCMRAKDRAELGFVLANDTWHLLPYRQAAVFQTDQLGRLALKTVSGLAAVTEDSPFTVWLSRLCGLASKEFTDARPARLAAAMFAEPVGDTWPEWWPPHALFVPLTSPQGERLGAVLLVRDEPWQDNDVQVLAELSETWSYCAYALRGPQRTLAQLLQKARTHPHRFLALAVLALALLCPVRLSVLAPAEIIALKAEAVTAPMEGVVKAFVAPPNSAVTQDQVLFLLDDTTLRNRRDVAQKALAVSRADALAAQQKAFDNLQSKSELGALLGRVKEKEAELAYLDEALSRVEVKSTLSGIFVYGDANDWLGKPVVTGERIGQLAQPDDLGMLVWVPVGDAINLEPGADMRVYLQVAPLSALSGQLVQASYQATLSPDGVSSYRVRGQLADGEAARIGMRGVAKIYGEWRPFIYWVLRRPLGAARQWLGL